MVSLESLDGGVLERIGFLGGIEVYRLMIRTIPKLAFREGVSYRAQRHFTVRTIRTDGIEEWRLNGKLHRVDGPALISGGHKQWWLNDMRHRVGGPARTWPDGSEEWLLNGKLHRVDGPARTWSDGSEEWWLDNKLHRVGGPARTWSDGREEWWFNGAEQPRPSIDDIETPTKRRKCL